MLTAEQLGITDAEYTALLTTRDLLAAEQPVINFDMGYCFTHTEACHACQVTEPLNLCGTTACIGGWMSLLMQNSGSLPDEITPQQALGMNEYVESYLYTGPLHNLFWGYPTIGVDPWQGVEAINNFLETGDPQWREVMKSL